MHEQLIESYEMNIYMLVILFILKLFYEIDLRLYFIVSVLNTTNPRIPRIVCYEAPRSRSKPAHATFKT